METKLDSNNVRDWAIFGVAAAVLAGLLVYHHSLTVPGGAARMRAESRAREWAATWPEQPRKTAGLMISRYGPPDRKTAESMIWNSRRPWKRIVVHRAAEGKPMEQAISYDIPPGKTAALVLFDHGLAVEPGSWEISARSDSEALNFLTLNLADDVAVGRMSPDEADTFFKKTVELRAAGKSSSYTDGLRFRPASADRPPITYRTIY